MSMWTQLRYASAWFLPSLCRKCTDFTAMHAAHVSRPGIFFSRSIITIPSAPLSANATTVLKDRWPSHRCHSKYKAGLLEPWKYSHSYARLVWWMEQKWVYTCIVKCQSHQNFLSPNGGSSIEALGQSAQSCMACGNLNTNQKMNVKKIYLFYIYLLQLHEFRSH